MRSYVLDQDIPSSPRHPIDDQRTTCEKWIEDDNKTRCYILASMSNKLQHQHEDMKTARGMLTTYKSCTVSKAVQLATKYPRDSSR